MKWQIGRRVVKAALVFSALSVLLHAVAAAQTQISNAGSRNLATPSPAVVRFALLGSQGDGNAGQFEVATALEAVKSARGFERVVLLGDNMMDNGVSSVFDPQWQTKFEVPYANVNAPFFAILGNHDYGGNGTGQDFSKGAHQVAYSSVSAKWEMPAAFYWSSLGIVDFFALDTNMQMFGMDAQQKTSIATWLASSQAPWKIVLGHHDYRSNGPSGNAGSYTGIPGAGAPVKNFLETIVAGNADLYISGSDRSLQWLSSTLQGTELIVSGAGAAASTLPGNQATHFQSAQKGFVYCIAMEKQLTVEFIGTAGQVLFKKTLTKP
jgi:tartrate-resistant acid phosphatase type 5